MLAHWVQLFPLGLDDPEGILDFAGSRAAGQWCLGWFAGSTRRIPCRP